MKQSIIALLRNAQNLSLGLIWLKDFPVKFQICAARCNCSHLCFTGSLVASIVLLQETCLLEEPSVLSPQFQASLSPGITTSYQYQLSARECIYTSELLGLPIST